MARKTAIVYDWIDKWGGVERLLLTLLDMCPEADWYTSYYDPHNASWAKDLKIHTSFIHKLPSFIKKSRILSLPLFPYAFESFDFTGYDQVISVTSSFAKGIITKPGTKHICYLLTPTRYLWGMTDEYLYGWKENASLPFLESLRKWDYLAAQRPDQIITLSHAVAERCRTYYRREPHVIYPPFDIDYWNYMKRTQKKLEGEIPEKYYLVVSRLESYKNVELAVDTFNELENMQLIIVGKGTRMQEIMRHAKDNIHFAERVTDEELAWLYTHAEGLIMPQEEDFGYVSLEAQICGCPVIAYNKGGAVETVKEGKSGLFFDRQDISSLRAVVARFHTVAYNIRSNLEKNAESYLAQFEKKEFIKKLGKYV